MEIVNHFLKREFVPNCAASKHRVQSAVWQRSVEFHRRGKISKTLWHYQLLKNFSA